MKGFKKLALVTAVAALPMSGFAMEALDDAALSDMTGQDGITIALDLNVSTSLWIEDTDGVPDGPGAWESNFLATDINGVNPGGVGYVTTYSTVDQGFGSEYAQTGLPVWSGLDNPGLIAISGADLTGTVTVDIDAGSSTGGGGVLNVGVNVGTLTVGAAGGVSIGVAASTNTGLAGIQAAPAVTEIMSLGQMTLNDVNLNIQLGPDAAEFLYLDAAPFDITMTNFQVNDANNGGGIRVGAVLVEGVDLRGTTAGITTDGLELTLGGYQGTDIALTGVIIGDMGATPSPALGNVYITGLDLSGTTVTVSGH